MPVLVLLGAPSVAAAEHGTRPATSTMKALGHSANPASIAAATANSDLAFWGDKAFEGTYDGFRIIDISEPDNPVEIKKQSCNGNQGDVVVWGDVLVRSWNAPAGDGATCDGEPVSAGFEGLHVFNIANLDDPQLVASVRTPCGSHTATGVPDVANGRLLVYNNGSSIDCPWFEVVEVPLDDPAGATVLRNEPVTGATRCHDIGVILGDANLATCASGAAATVYDIGTNSIPGGSLEDPQHLYNIAEPGVGVGGNWHSAAFTWDGEVLVLGWEPGGGSAPECESTDPAVKKSAFFYDTATGAKLGQWTLPRGQDGAGENCTIHNYTVVPLRSGRYVMAGGHYQAGTWVVDFTDPANPTNPGWSDPPPLVPPELGGAWSSYWYNGFIYESEITRGLNVFRFNGPETAGAMRLRHLNPQTQEFSIG